MKKILYSILILFSFIGCGDSSDENIIDIPEPAKTLSIKQDSIILYRAESKTVDVILEGLENTDIKWSTSNSFIATPIDQGAFGYHVGETFLIATCDNLADSCKIIVKPKQTFFSEPICEWGKDRKYIREKEIRSVIVDHVGSYASLAYSAGEGIINYQFSLPDSLLIGASVSLSYKDMINASDFLLERYSLEDDCFYSSNTKIEIKMTQGRSLDVLYSPIQN